jgi:hypothetical protein
MLHTKPGESIEEYHEAIETWEKAIEAVPREMGEA